MFKLRSAYPSGQQQPLTNVKKIHNEFWSVEISQTWKKHVEKASEKAIFWEWTDSQSAYQWMFDDFWWFLSGVDCSIGAAATGEFHALGDACKSGLLYLHETSPPEANLKPSRRRDSPNRSRTEPEVSGESSVFNILILGGRDYSILWLCAVVAVVSSPWKSTRWLGDGGGAVGHGRLSIEIWHSISTKKCSKS